MSCQKQTGSCFLDTTALIPYCQPGHQNSRIVTRYLSGLSEKWIDFVVMSEFLSGIDGSEKRKEAYSCLSRQFKTAHIIPSASLVAAEIFSICREKGIVNRKDNTEKQIVKADILIATAATMLKCDQFLYEDKNLKAISEAIGETVLGYPVPRFVRSAIFSGNFLIDNPCPPERIYL